MFPESNWRSRERSDYDRKNERGDEIEDKRRTRPPPIKRGRSPHHMGNSPSPSSGGYPIYEEPPLKRRKYDGPEDFPRVQRPPMHHYDPPMQDFPSYHRHGPMYPVDRDMYIKPGKHSFYRDRPLPEDFPRGGRPPPRDRSFPRQPYMYRGDMRPFGPPVGPVPVPYPSRDYHYSPRRYPFRDPDVDFDNRGRGRIRDRRRRPRGGRRSRDSYRMGRSRSRSPSESSDRSLSRSPSRSPSQNSNQSGSRRSSRSRSSGSNRSTTTSPDSKDPSSSSGPREDDSKNKDALTPLRDTGSGKEESSPLSSSKKEDSLISSDEESSSRSSDRYRSRRRHRDSSHPRHYRRYRRSHSSHHRYYDTRPHYRHMHYHRHSSRHPYSHYNGSPGGRWRSDRYGGAIPFRKRYETSPISRSRSRSNSIDIEYRSPSDPMTPTRPRRSRSPPHTLRQGPETTLDASSTPRGHTPLPPSSLDSPRAGQPMPPPPPPPPPSQSPPPSPLSSSPSSASNKHESHYIGTKRDNQGSEGLDSKKESNTTLQNETLSNKDANERPQSSNSTLDTIKHKELEQADSSNAKTNDLTKSEESNIDKTDSQAKTKVEDTEQQKDKPNYSISSSGENQHYNESQHHNNNITTVFESTEKIKPSSETTTTMFDSSPSKVSSTIKDVSQETNTSELPSKAKLLESIRKLDVEISNVTTALKSAKQPVLKKTKRKKKRRRKRRVISSNTTEKRETVQPMQIDESQDVDTVTSKTYDFTRTVNQFEKDLEESDPDCMSLPEHILYTNRQKAKQAEAQLHGLTPPSLIAIYAQYDVSELSLIEENNRKHQSQVNSIMEVVRERHQKIKRRTQIMHENYLQKWKEWDQKSSQKSSKQSQDCVRSEAEYERVMARLQHEEETKKRYIKTLADIPRLLTPEEREEERFYDRNQLVPDSMHETRMRRIREEAWTSAEKQTFFSIFIKYPKDMRKIASFLPNKTTGDVVNFYYNHKTDPGFRKLIDDYQLKNTYRKIVSEGSASANQGSSARMASTRRRDPNSSSSDLEGLVPRELRSLGVTPNDYATMNVGRGRPRSSRRPSNAVSISAITQEGNSSTLPTSVTSTVAGSTTQDTESARIQIASRHLQQPPQLPSLSQAQQQQLQQSYQQPTFGSHQPQQMSHFHHEEDNVRWTEDEKVKFIELLKKHGRNFEAISAGIRSKSQSQCKNYFHNNKKKLGLEQLVPQRSKDQRRKRKPGRKPGDGGESQPQRRRRAWSDEERAVLLQCLSKFGPDWAKIGEHMPQKTRTQIRNYFAANKSKLCAELNQHPSTLTKKKPSRGRRPARSRNTEGSSAFPGNTPADLSQLASVAVQGRTTPKQEGERGEEVSSTATHNVKQEDDKIYSERAQPAAMPKNSQDGAPSQSENSPPQTVPKQEGVQKDTSDDSSQSLPSAAASSSAPAQNASSSSSSSSGFPTIRDLMARVMTSGSGSGSDTNIPAVTELRPPLSYNAITPPPHGIPPPRQTQQSSSLNPSGGSILSAPPLTAQLQQQKQQQHSSLASSAGSQQQNTQFSYQQSQQQPQQQTQPVLPFPVSTTSSAESSSKQPKAHLSSISALLNSDSSSAPEAASASGSGSDHPWLLSGGMFPASAPGASAMKSDTTNYNNNNNNNNNNNLGGNNASAPTSVLSNHSRSFPFQQQSTQQPTSLSSSALHSQYISSAQSTGLLAKNSSSTIPVAGAAEQRDNSDGHTKHEDNSNTQSGGNQHNVRTTESDTAQDNPTPSNSHSETSTPPMSDSTTQ